MKDRFDVCIKDAYLQSRDKVVDIIIQDGQIDRIETDSTSDAKTVIEADGNLVTPGFVDAHVHLDQALSQRGKRKPEYGDQPFQMQRVLSLAQDYFTRTNQEEITRTAVKVGERAVANGILHLRTHAYVDESIETKAVAAMRIARERLDHALDIEIVAFPQQGVLKGGTEEALRKSMRHGANLVGGIDPALHNRDIEQTVSTWFDVATDHDADIDIHLHERGMLGLYTLEKFITGARDNQYEGRVTASHAYALADAYAPDGEWVSDSDAERVLQKAADADLGIVTCYLTTKPTMPVSQIRKAGVAFGHGSDQVQDIWSPHGNISPIEEGFVQSLTLRKRSPINDHLDSIWHLLTTGGAAVLGIDGHGIFPGTAADIVVHGNTSRQWTLIKQSTPEVVLKDGVVVARNGEFIG